MSKGRLSARSSGKIPKGGIAFSRLNRRGARDERRRGRQAAANGDANSVRVHFADARWLDRVAGVPRRRGPFPQP